MNRFLLIDDDEFEPIVVTRILANKYGYGYKLDHAKSLKKAKKLMNKHNYSLVLLDDQLSDTIDARTSVIAVRALLNDTPLIIISHDIEKEYLRDITVTQGVPVVHKNDLPDFVYKAA
jgi:CheY-like chemotaxis protein